ncbi:hypothetical protein HMF8227_01230 [Saliniradius amylolyticus]|uniref:ABM domain-containing protein n=1 Tax=Saliniradius amylolyticus TaxID=2183582 RepID=A0A2S2E240_9ALTE|nr:antibiotic biosynthesis monooxygenase [Saliniradius amylolyticus]AWL11711.1 hypothetical protein HMF8227_01230 [Saliniradius amylolyticus]
MKYLFEIKVDSDHRAEDYAQAWLAASRLIQQAAGAQGTELHRDLSDPQRLIAIAHWETKAQRDAMEQHKPSQVMAIIKRAAEFCKVTPIGEFAEPEWRVLPSELPETKSDQREG